MDISFNHYKEIVYKSRSFSINSNTSIYSFASNNSLNSLSTMDSCDSLNNLETSHDLKPIKHNNFFDISNNKYRQYNKRVRDAYINERNTPDIDTFESIMVRRNSREY